MFEKIHVIKRIILTSVFLSSSSLSLTTNSFAIGCLDETFTKARDHAEETKDFTTFWAEIDLENGKCLLDKYYSKAVHIILGNVNQDTCTAVYFLERALDENYLNRNDITIFETNENTIFDLLNPVYSGGYIEFSAVEGRFYSLYKIQQKRIEILKQSFFSSAATSNKKEEYALETLSNIIEIRENSDIDVSREEEFIRSIISDPDFQPDLPRFSPRKIVCNPNRIAK
ncbi:MAG: hypothetical protein K5905_03910 [Roseibium sp.]|uniref:hypothetical protein n=1 Tax=Roseibium sp. TaxID=1936156 RepID=UPI002607513F|nr:hypothetical protein [Roseibium sp.]MCV0424596.1 hypothetical protein [Roseibium sp.]